MKLTKQDAYTLLIILAVLMLFFLSETVLQGYLQFNKNHGMITSFLKFGILATFGEMLGLRLRTGNYYNKNFGLFPKFIVWGFLGLTIKMAFVIFAVGTPQFLAYLGFTEATQLMSTTLSPAKIAVALCISAAMNSIYAPVMMTFHKITDLHIASYHGKITSLVKPVNFALNFQSIDWKVQWNFVFKKTIPLFWIPAHTLTFLLPSEFQVLFAALLSILLGLILAIASLKSEK
jgi:hypothetical protein